MTKAEVWTHGLAWALLAVTLAMICLGGLVAGFRAGMAVTDWPTTFGYNPLLYPLRDWLAARDVRLAHGHRLLGVVLGSLTLILAVALWTTERRASIRWLALALVAGWCVQELLGGLRVLNDEVLWAKIHGCTAPLFLAAVAAITGATSPAWRRAAPTSGGASSRRLRRWALVALVFVYVQIVLGAQLRRLPPETATGWFVAWLWLYLLVTAALMVLAVAMVLVVGRSSSGRPGLHGRAWWFAALVVIQTALGAAVWVTNFGWPRWFTRLFGPPDYTVAAEGDLQVLAAAAHVAVGSLCLVAALSMVLWAGRRGIRD